MLFGVVLRLPCAASNGPRSGPRWGCSGPPSYTRVKFPIELHTSNQDGPSKSSISCWIDRSHGRRPLDLRRGFCGAGRLPRPPGHRGRPALGTRCGSAPYLESGSMWNQARSSTRTRLSRWTPYHEAWAKDRSDGRDHAVPERFTGQPGATSESRA